MLDDIKNSAISDLESKEISIASQTLFLYSQGYVVNRNKFIKQSWISILLQAVKDIDLYTVEQQDKILRLIKKVYML